MLLIWMDFMTIEYNKNMLQSYGVKKIGLFGSYVHNQQNKNSDIDILVEFHANKKIIITL